MFICGAVMTLFTEFTSNTSSASIFLPILAQLVSNDLVMISHNLLLLYKLISNSMTYSHLSPLLQSVRLSIHPLYLLIPVTICSSYAFAFPVATPPNAIVFSYGFLRVIDMVSDSVSLYSIHWLSFIIIYYLLFIIN